VRGSPRDLFEGLLRNVQKNHSMVLGKNVREHFSSHQWKGGGIDGGVSPRTGASERIALAHCAGT
jgi:hypothetical protein